MMAGPNTNPADVSNNQLNRTNPAVCVCIYCLNKVCGPSFDPLNQVSTFRLSLKTLLCGLLLGSLCQWSTAVIVALIEVCLIAGSLEDHQVVANLILPHVPFSFFKEIAQIS